MALSLRQLTRSVPSPLLRAAKRMAAQAAAQERGHQAPAGPPPDEELARLREHQSKAARQPFADECRTLLRLSRYGVLSTLSVGGEAAGFPGGAIVGFADAEADGAPLFCFSSMSGHTRDVAADGRASLTVTAPGFEGAADARVSLMGRLVRVPEAEVGAARERYLAVHPDAFWVTFGDFSWWRMAEVVSIRLVGGFARAGSVPPAIYASAHPDPVAGACDSQLRWAAEQGEAAWAAAVKADAGGEVAVDGARVVSLDRLGLNLQATRGQDKYKLRLPFATPADTPEAVGERMRALIAASATVAV
jgi:putative heme iron utilization protein